MRYTYEEILGQMKSEYRNSCGTEVHADSDEDKKIKLLASELFSLSCYGDFIRKQAFVQSAEGEYLDRHGALRNCPRKAGGKAEGRISFAVMNPLDYDIVIKKSTICSVSGKPHLQYETTMDIYLDAGFCEAIVPARALGEGEEYNVDIGEINVMVNGPIGIEAVWNSTKFTGGYSGESDSSYRERLMASYVSPSLYMCKEEIRSRVLQLDYIIDCSLPNVSTAGRVDMFVRTPSGTLSNNELTELVQYVGVGELLGMDLNISCAKALNTDISVSVKVSSDADKEALRTEIEAYIREYMSTQKIGSNVPIAPIYKFIYSLDGVEKLDIYSDILITESLLCDSDKYIVLGELAVNFYE